MKLSFFFSKLPEVSFDQFHRHWETVHADLTVATKSFADNKIQRYVQVRALPELKEKARALPGTEFIDCDGCSEIYVREWEDWERFGGVGFVHFYTMRLRPDHEQDPEWTEKLFPDTKHFMAMVGSSLSHCSAAEADHLLLQPIRVMAGYENLIYGAAVQEGGKDGISEAELPANGEETKSGPTAASKGAPVEQGRSDLVTA